MRPPDKKVFFRKEEAPETTGSIIYKEKQNQAYGTVTAVGSEVFSVKEGDRICVPLGKYKKVELEEIVYSILEDEIYFVCTPAGN